MSVMLLGVVHHAIIADHRNALLVAKLDHAADHILSTLKGAVHFTAFRWKITKSNVRLEIYHSTFDFSSLEICHIVLGGKLGQESVVPIGYVHVAKMPSVTVFIPHIVLLYDFMY